MYEGEVTELTPEETENPVRFSSVCTPANLRLTNLRLTAPQLGYGKVLSHVIIGLKTVKGTKQLKLDPSIYDGLQKEKVCAQPSSRSS